MKAKTRNIALSAFLSLFLFSCEKQSYAEIPQECTPAKPGGAENVVMNLYNNYPAGGSKVIKNEPKEALLRYFDETLTSLIIRNQECEKGGELCNVDFDILFAAQDVDIKNFRVCRISPETNIVEVRFMNMEKSIIIKYKLMPKDQRISDIIYPDGSSLARILTE